MASLHHLLLLLLCFIIVHLLCNGGGADARFQINADLPTLDKICKQSQDYDFCLRTISKDPRFAAADVPRLATLSISLIIIQIQDTSSRIPGILKTITDPVGKQRLELCQKDYGNALPAFQSAFSSSSARSFWDVIDYVRIGTNLIIDCEDTYRRKEPIAVSPITVDNHNVIKLSEIVLIIVECLLPH